MLAENLSYYFNNDPAPQLMADSRPVSILWANNVRLKQIVFNIRYQVYCEQLGYENTTNNPDQMEMDRFDGWSQHLLIRDDLTSNYVGTMRIVEPAKHEHLIPIEEHYHGDFISPVHDPAKYNAGRYVEISRLAVNPSVVGKLSMRYASDVSKLLYLTAIAYFQKSVRLSELFWLAEQRLARRLSILGLPSQQIGNFIDYRGQRAPFIMKKERLLLPRGPSRNSLKNPCNPSPVTIVKPLSLNFKSASKAIYQQILDHKLYLPGSPKQTCA